MGRVREEAFYSVVKKWRSGRFAHESVSHFHAVEESQI
jgi:hypothetical protein